MSASHLQLHKFPGAATESNLEELLRRNDLWRGGGREARSGQGALPTGVEALDAQLPDGGLPRGALTEVLCAHSGIGELEILLPALARVSRAGQWQAWVAPPHIPYAPALAAAGIALEHLLLIRPDKPEAALWALEQSLRSGACGAVLGWPRDADDRALRRLQLAAEEGEAAGILFRPLGEARHASSAALRLQLESAADGSRVQILKRRGGWGTRPVALRA